MARVLAAELATLATTEREDLFYQKVATRTLLLYELGRRPERPRPFYLCVDVSGSMAGEKEVWAKAMALALGNLALARGRPVTVILFGDAEDPLKRVTIEPHDSSEVRLERFTDVAAWFLGGGTDFVQPLTAVTESVVAAGPGGADLLFVSDGLCPLPEEFVHRFGEVKRQYDLRMTSVVIGDRPFTLADVSDELFRLDEALDEGEAVVARSAVVAFDPVSAPPPAPRRGGRPRRVPRLYERFVPRPE